MSEKTPQSFENHAKIVPGFHGVLTGILVLALVGAATEVVRSVLRGSGRLDAGVILLVVVGMGFLFWYTRIFPLKAQDRAIRAEENFRHYLLTGSPLDSRLRIRQIIALRFASDEELPELARRAVDDGLSATEIKKAIRDWKPDTYRV